MSGETLLRIDKTTRTFGSFTAVDTISFEVKSGEIFALLGPNGAGKTTSMKMITGTLRPTKGRLTLQGYDCFSERHLCMAVTGYVPDEPAFPAFVRAGELIRFYGEIHGLSIYETKMRSTPLIKRLELEDDLNEFAVNFSKGMKKKLALILALLHKPRMLILDELTNGLDPYATRELHQIMCEQRDAGCAILFSTHLLDQAERLCDRVAIINKGKIAIIGTLDELKEKNSDLEQLFFKHTDQHSGDNEQKIVTPLQVDESEVSESEKSPQCSEVLPPSSSENHIDK